MARVHRRHIANIDRIRGIQPWDSGDFRIMLADDSFVNFSRRYRSRLPQPSTDSRHGPPLAILRLAGTPPGN